MLAYVILKGGDLSALYGLYKEFGGHIATAGFVFAAVGVLLKCRSNPELLEKAIVKYVIALIVWILIWGLI